MKYLVLLLASSCLYTNAYADNILSALALNDLINTTIRNQFLTAAMTNPDIFKSERDDLIFTAETKPTANSEFTAFNSSFSIRNGTTAIEESGSHTSSGQVIWRATDELNNLYDPRPGSPNVVQTMYTQSYQQSNKTSVATTTSCGWENSNTLSITYFFQTSIGGFAINPSVTATVYGSTSKTTTTENTEAYTTPTTPILVPNGCKAVVTQSLETATKTGFFSFADIVYNTKVEFKIKNCRNCREIHGYANAYDILTAAQQASTKIPQTALRLSPQSHDILVVGYGSYTASTANIYRISYKYENADASNPICIPPSLNQQKQLLSAQKTKYSLQQLADNNFVYTRTLIAQPVGVAKITQHRSLKGHTNDECWKTLEH